MSAAVLAGGASRRMGTDKRGLLIGGQTLLARAVRTAMAVSDDVMVVVAADRPVHRRSLRGLRWRPVVDRRTGVGPLAGLEAALDAARHQRVVALPVDAPALSPALLRLLIQRTVAAGLPGGVFMSQTGPQPLPCVLDRSALTQLGSLLDAGDYRLTGLLHLVPMTVVDEDAWRTHDPQGQWLVNLNRPRDLDQLDARGIRAPDRASPR